MATEIEEPQIPDTSDAESAMRDLIAPADEPTTTPPAEEGDTPPADTPPDDKAGEKPSGEEPPKEDEPAAPATEIPDDDNFDAEIDQIQLKPTASAKSKEGLAILKERAKAEHKAAKEAARRAKELEQSQSEVQARIQELEAKVLTPEVEQELTNLRQFRDTFGLEDDPSLNKPFEDRINNATTSLSKTMEQIGVPAATIKYINDNGGLYNFRLSNNPMPAAVKDPTTGRPMTQAQFYKRFIEGNLNEAQKEELTDSYAEIRRAQKERQAAIDNLKTNRAEFQKKRKESIEAAQKDWADRVVKHSEKVLKEYGDIATLKDIPLNATPEQKAALEKHNENYRKAEATAHKILAEVTPENLTEAAIAAGYATIMRESNATLQSKLDATTKERDELQKKYDDLRNAGKTSDLRGTQEAAKAAAAGKAKNAEDAMASLVNQGNE